MEKLGCKPTRVAKVIGSGNDVALISVKPPESKKSQDAMEVESLEDENLDMEKTFSNESLELLRESAQGFTAKRLHLPGAT